jgi:hypothetical protein
MYYCVHCKLTTRYVTSIAQRLLTTQSSNYRTAVGDTFGVHYDQSFDEIGV